MPLVPTDSFDVQTVALVGTYVPKRCGIASFTKNLRDGIQEEGGRQRTLVVALDDKAEGYLYPEEVSFQVQIHQRRDYLTAGDLLNINQIDIAIVQHEYGIYGGQDGSHVLELVRRLRMPVITTLHTALTEPSSSQRAVLNELIHMSDRVAVMSQCAAKILEETYDAPQGRIAVIPHGIHDMPFVDPSFYKDQFGVEGRRVILTCGLLSENKGVEVALRALPRIVERHPDVVYIILGATHPEVLRREGNAHRNALERLTDQLGVRDHVVFHNHYVTLEELCGYLGAADIYVTPYRSKEQISSGTLTYAMGAGKAVVSTPYWYAEEMLADGRGLLFPFGDSEVLAAHVNELLDNAVERDAMRKRAYLFCRGAVWKEVARSYLQLAREVRLERRDHPRPVFYLRAEEADDHSLPEVDLRHLRTLTDDTGILQHAIYAVPDRLHGYCTDDNARALVMAILHYGLAKDQSVLALANTYLAFVHHAFNRQSRRFRNFLTYDRRWTEDVGSEDTHGRCLWALGLTTALAPNDAMMSFATRLFGDALEVAETLQSPRAWAFALIGIHRYLSRFGGDAKARRARAVLADRLFALFEQNSVTDWPWCEDVLTYANARLPHALILSGQWLPNSDMLRQGLDSLTWLVRQQIREDGTVSLIGNQGYMSRSGQRARFDQQPIEAMALIQACAEASRCTNGQVWRQRTRQVLRWFLGANDTESLLFDYHTGGCRDGLHADGPNLNEGAESTLAWLISLITVTNSGDTILNY